MGGDDLKQKEDGKPQRRAFKPSDALTPRWKLKDSEDLLPRSMAPRLRERLPWQCEEYLSGQATPNPLPVPRAAFARQQWELWLEVWRGLSAFKGDDPAEVALAYQQAMMWSAIANVLEHYEDQWRGR